MNVFCFSVVRPLEKLLKLLPASLLSSKAAILSSYSIFAARREPSWENPTPLTVQ